MKKIIFIFIIIFSINIFAIDYDENIKKALKLSWNKEYEKAENIFLELLKEYPTDELMIAYTNNLAYSKKTKEAIKILKNLKNNSNDIKLQLAKMYYWNDNNSKAVKLYKSLENSEIKLKDNHKENYNKLKNYKKYKMKYTYKGDLTSNDPIELPSFYITYDNYSEYQIVYSREYYLVNTKKKNVDDFLELYIKKNLYFILGKSEIKDYYIGGDFIYKFLTLGYRYNKLEIDSYNHYKIEFNNYIKNLRVLNQANFIIDGDNFYKFELEYKKNTVSLFYNEKEFQVLELEHERVFNEIITGSIGVYRKLNDNLFGYSFDLEISF